MKVKLFNKTLGDFDNVYFSADLHINHEAVIKFGRRFRRIEDMNDHIYETINVMCKENDLLILIGDTLMIDKNYNDFISKIKCFVIILYGNHCNRNRFSEVKDEPFNRLLYHGDYALLNIGGQFIVCQHHPMFHWDYQSDHSWMLHGHTHAYESEILKKIHEYKCIDVGIDSYFEKFKTYNLFSYHQIHDLLKDNKIIDRH